MKGKEAERCHQKRSQLKSNHKSSEKKSKTKKGLVTADLKTEMLVLPKVKALNKWEGRDLVLKWGQSCCLKKNKNWFRHLVRQEELVLIAKTNCQKKYKSKLPSKRCIARKKAEQNWFLNNKKFKKLKIEVNEEGQKKELRMELKLYRVTSNVKQSSNSLKRLMISLCYPKRN